VCKIPIETAASQLKIGSQTFLAAAVKFTGEEEKRHKELLNQLLSLVSNVVVNGCDSHVTPCSSSSSSSSTQSVTPRSLFVSILASSQWLEHYCIAMPRQAALGRDSSLVIDCISLARDSVAHALRPPFQLSSAAQFSSIRFIDLSCESYILHSINLLTPRQL